MAAPRMQRNKYVFFRFTASLQLDFHLENHRSILRGAQRFFVRRANRLIRAIAAHVTRFRNEFPGANVRCRFLDDTQRLVKLPLVSSSFLPLIVLQVMENHANGIPLKNLFCGDCVDAQLQVFLRVRILFRLARLVIDDLYVVRLNGRRAVNRPSELTWSIRPFRMTLFSTGSSKFFSSSSTSNGCSSTA